MIATIFIEETLWGLLPVAILVVVLFVVEKRQRNKIDKDKK